MLVVSSQGRGKKKTRKRTSIHDHLGSRQHAMGARRLAVAEGKEWGSGVPMPVSHPGISPALTHPTLCVVFQNLPGACGGFSSAM